MGLPPGCRLYCLQGGFYGRHGVRDLYSRFLAAFATKTLFMDELIMNVHQALTREFGEGVQVLVYMFDGLIVRFDSLGNDDKLRDVLTKVGEKANVSFTCEKF